MKYAHVGINVTDLEQAVDFYSKLFNVKPLKVEKDYAKFLLEKPGLNFTLNLQPSVAGNQVNHFGFQVDKPEEIAHNKERLMQAGLPIQLEENDTVCCYALQDKFWVRDPDGNEWEFFYTKEDRPLSVSGNTACCQG